VGSLTTTNKGVKLSKLFLNSALNEPQLQAVTSIEGPVLIIAGAGSGKTRVITYRIAHMLEKGIPQHSILALTFTNKAAKEMETRVKQLTGKKLQNLTVSTFHSFGLSVIKNEAEHLGYRKNFSVYDESDKMTLLKESLIECRLSSKKINLYALGQFFSNIKTGLCEWTEEDAAMQPVYEEYQQGLKAYNAVDFDDLLVLPLELFQQNPAILEKYQSRFRYIMVDEFQDTSLIQYKLMRILALSEKEQTKNGNRPNVCAVGDDDQSIYSWRGANYRNFLLFEKDFGKVKEIKLEQNYRSTSTILEAANGVIAHNSGRKEKKLWSGKNEGKPITLIFPEDERAEAEFIASQIQMQVYSHSFQYHNFGVLTRTNSLAGNIEEAFLAENIPYIVSGGTSFFQRKEIKDIISYLRVIANPYDDISLLRIINMPARGIGKTTVAALGEIAKKNNACIWDAIMRLNHARSEGQQVLFSDKKTLTELEEFARLIETYKDAILEQKSEKGSPWLLSQKTRELVDAIDYWAYLLREHGKEDKKAKWKFNNIEKFIRMMENWERDPDTMDRGLYAWLNRISLITKDDGEADTDGKVSLMTIHSAKGLEFPVVFIAGAEDGLIPHKKAIDEDNETASGFTGQSFNGLEAFEEERRLFYVAITRAQEKLYISACKNRRYLQSADECTPSPFLQEIPGGLIQTHQPISEDEDKALSDNLLNAIKERLRKK